MVPHRFLVSFGVSFGVLCGLIGCMLGQSETARGQDAEAIMPGIGTTLTVTVDQINKAQGRVYVTLFANPQTWLDDQKSLQDQSTEAKLGSVSVTFEHVVPGRYAIVTFHDDNGSGEMEFNALGYPTKGYAFSNDVRPFLSAPSFEKAAIMVAEKPTEIHIKMVYP